MADKSDSSEVNEQKSSFGRNIFIEKRRKAAEEKTVESVELDHTQNLSGDDDVNLKSHTESVEFSNEIKEKHKPAVSAKKTDCNVTSLFVNETHSVLVSTFFNGISYTVHNVVIEPVEVAQITDDNFLKANAAEMHYKNQVDAIKRTIDKSGLSKKDLEVVTAIGGKGVVVKQLQVNSTELAHIESELPKLIVNSFDNSMGRYEYVLLGSETENGELIHNILASCVDTKVFFNLQGLLATAGVHCSIMDVEVMAVVNLYLQSVEPKDDEVNCIIDIGNDVSSVIIHAPAAKESLFIRNLDFTFTAFCKLMAQNRECSIHEAEKMISERNFSEYFTKAFEQESSENLNELYSIKGYLKRDLQTELQRTFQYYIRKANNRAPSKIYVTGKAVNMKNFTQFLVKNFDLKCEELDVGGFLMGDSHLKNMINENKAITYKAVGLALRYE